ncbi:recombination protein RecO [Helicobacter sp. 13S00401-1]|uniref:recombination protein RecO n=1 Tax=Helicobacter sp. 13S00401-1 TaxID=1905758 RepID=UPI000BA7E50C|nr:recombination protein RecO [Helicobacter sp. 13S00401-1]PAF51173.1 recombination protein RecO [Helicobacter sp. 13S00401-1]
MEGYILAIIKSTREDLIVRILSKHKMLTLYRFYGARHSILYVGRKIDFEVESNSLHMLKLRNIMHLNHNFELDLEKMYVWQRYLGLLNRHLEDISECSSFYYDLLEFGAKALLKQEAKSLILQMHAKLLNYEGRDFNASECVLCEEPLGEVVALTQGFNLACTKCLPKSFSLQKKHFFKYLQSGSCLHLDEHEINGLYKTLLFGI